MKRYHKLVFTIDINGQKQKITRYCNSLYGVEKTCEKVFCTYCLYVNKYFLPLEHYTLNRKSNNYELWYANSY